MSIDKEADKSGGGKPKPKPSSPPPPRVDPKLIGNEHKKVPGRPKEPRESGKEKRGK